MTIRILSQLRKIKQALFFTLCAAVVLAACSGSPSPAVDANQSALPTQVSTQVQQPTQTQASVETLSPTENLTPVETQADVTTPTPMVSSFGSVCALITKEEAEAALGTPVSDPVEQNFPPVFSCRYNDTENIYLVDVTVVEFSDAAEAQDVFQMAVDLNQYPVVSGFGDRAYLSTIYDIVVDKGKYELSVSVSSSEEDDVQLEKAKALAMSALARLP